LAQVTGLACGIVGIRIMSHLVAPDDLGTYGVFLTFTPIGMWIVHSGLIKFVGRSWAAGDHSTLVPAIARTWTRKLGWLLLASAIASALIARTTPLSLVAIFVAVLLAAAFLSLGALAQTALQASRHNWFDLAASASGSITRTFLPPIAFVAIGVIGLYAGFVLHTAVLAALACVGVLLTRKKRTASTGQTRVAPIYEGTLFTTLAFVGWMLAGQNRWFVAFFFGRTITGHFTLASNVALIIPSMLGAVILQWLQPRLYALGDNSTYEQRHRLSRELDRGAVACFACGLIGVVGLRLAAPYLIGPLIAARYADCVDWLLPVGCFGLSTTVAGFYHTLLLAGRREQACGPVDLSSAAVWTAGGAITAEIGPETFRTWLMLTAIVPWVVTRPLARRHFFRPAASATPTPDR
jgi:O-antigen/teichoic acid export membrane protein